MVPVALRPARDTTRPFLLWSDRRFGWNCLALPPPVGRARASDVDELGQRDTWQRAPLVLPRRRFRYGTEKGTHALVPGSKRSRTRTRIPEHRSSRSGIRTDT